MSGLMYTDKLGCCYTKENPTKNSPVSALSFRVVGIESSDE